MKMNFLAQKILNVKSLDKLSVVFWKKKSLMTDKVWKILHRTDKDKKYKTISNLSQHLVYDKNVSDYNQSISKILKPSLWQTYYKMEISLSFHLSLILLGEKPGGISYNLWSINRFISN